MHACQNQLAFACYLGVTLLDAAGALTDRLYLGAGQHDTRFKAVLNDVIVERLLVIRYYLT